MEARENLANLANLARRLFLQPEQLQLVASDIGKPVQDRRVKSVVTLGPTGLAESSRATPFGLHTVSYRAELPHVGTYPGLQVDDG